MMQEITISWWGVVLVVLLLAATLGIFLVVDRRMMQRSLRALLLLAGSLLMVGGYVWGLFKLQAWWADLLWLLLMVGAVSFQSLRRAHLQGRSLVPLCCAVLVGTLLAGVCMMCSMNGFGSTFIFVPVMAIILGHLLNAATSALQTYVGSFLHTQAHYQYLLANGASHLEAVMPSVRRAMRATVLPSLRLWSSPVVLSPPLLLFGLLLGGVSPVMAVLLTLFFLMSMFSASVITTVVLLWLSDRYLFDAQGQFLP